MRDLATFSLVSIAPDAPLFDVLALMIRHQVHRLVVADGPRIVFVMGSEGRGEKLLKTDQDNGLVLRDDTTVSDAVVESACLRFSAALRDFGYPDCPGRIMVSDPAWRHSADEFRVLVRRWLLLPDPEGLMALATFVDAHAVAGDSSLLGGVRAEIDRLVVANDALLGQFARAIDLFPDAPSGWWSRLLLFGEHEPLLGLRLPQPKIEVSAMYYDYRNRQLPAHLRGGTIDLRFATMMNDLGLPLRATHDALDDAVTAGLAFVKLRSRCWRRDSAPRAYSMPLPTASCRS